MIEEYEGEPERIEDIENVRETMRREIEDAGY